jgi:hypothetical protein
VVGAVRAVHVAIGDLEARPLVDDDRAPVEGGDGERVALGAAEAQAGLEEARAEALAREVGPQPEADLGGVLVRLEDEEAGELAIGVGGEVAAAPLARVEQLGEVAGVLIPVVERVTARGSATPRSPRRRPRSSPGWRTSPRR